MAITSPAHGVGELLRGWRRRRNLSQMEVALTAAVSNRHLSFIETGRARPSREMVLHLAERLEVPLRERNGLLLAAGYAPEYRERALDDDDMAAVRDALGRFLSAHEPYPALVADRRCDIVMTNASLGVLLEGVAPELLEPPANTLRIALHPDGMAPHIVNLAGDERPPAPGPAAADRRRGRPGARDAPRRARRATRGCGWSRSTRAPRPASSCRCACGGGTGASSRSC